MKLLSLFAIISTSFASIMSSNMSLVPLPYDNVKYVLRGSYYSNQYLISLNSTTDCTTSGMLATNVVAFIQPDPPVLGSPVNLTILYDLKEDVNNGVVKYHAVVNGFLPVDTSVDLCEDHRGGSDPCPLLTADNPHVVTGRSDFPTGIKRISSTINWSREDGFPILCVKMDYSW